LRKSKPTGKMSLTGLKKFATIFICMVKNRFRVQRFWVQRFWVLGSGFRVQG
jgi:hypothetical protein